MEILKSMKINIPFSEALSKMPSYAKFMKELLSNKRKLKEDETITMTEECSAIIQRKLPQKQNDKGPFTIPCSIEDTSIGKALIDLGASINLMPLSINKKLKMEDIKPTRMSLQLADRSFKSPYGIVEDVLVKVDKFIFPADFVILDIEADEDIPIILGRPFLSTGRAIIDVAQGEFILRVGDEKVSFNIFDAMKFPSKKPSCMSIEVIDSLVLEMLEEQENSLLEQRIHFSKEAECSSVSETNELKSVEIENSPSNEQSQTFEKTSHDLKQLPSHLKYLFLGENKTFPVIISSSLTTLQEEKLFEILKSHKSAIGWQISDLKGISPSFCMHKILLEDDYKPVVQPQRRLNPTMQEVVQKEVIKLLDAGIIYPISDSSWVSPVQVVPKKGGMTVIVNEKEELVPT